MKKAIATSFALASALSLSACGEEVIEPKTNDAEETVTTEETKAQEEVVEYTAKEPEEDEMCAFCNMKVYHKDHDMGSFTAQGVTEDGEHVFFDDSGCLLNYERKTGTELAASWVRDYQTDEWVEADDTVVVKSDIATPMKYGYAFFSNQEEADAFIAGHADLNAELVTWDDVDAVSNERYMKKMQKMNKDDSTEEMDMSTEEKDMNTEETESHTNE